MNLSSIHHKKQPSYTLKREVLSLIHEELIKGTMPGAAVTNKTVFLCQTNPQTTRYASLNEAKVYLSSKTLKHMYDKRSAQEYDCLINSIHKIVKYPDHIYKNKDVKRGDFIFVKAVNGYSYMCSVQYIDDNKVRKLSVVTAFSVKPSYMKNFKLLWSWRKRHVDELLLSMVT